MTASAPAVGIAAFAVDAVRARTLEVQSSGRVHGASAVKPLLAWIAAEEAQFADDRSTWASLAQRAVTISDNEAIAVLWSRVGGQRLLASVNERIGLAWKVDGVGEHPSLRISVTAGELARAYVELAADDTDVGRQVRQWMREVPATQSFGVRQVVCETLSVEETVVGVKCGWFGGERAHAIVMTETAGRTIGAVVTTRSSPDRADCVLVREAIGNDDMLAAAHDALVGDHIRSALRRALTAAAEL